MQPSIRSSQPRSPEQNKRTCFLDDEISPENSCQVSAVVLVGHDLLDGVVRLREAPFPVPARIDGFDGSTGQKAGYLRVRLSLLAKLEKK